MRRGVLLWKPFPGFTALHHHPRDPWVVRTRRCMPMVVKVMCRYFWLTGALQLPSAYDACAGAGQQTGQHGVRIVATGCLWVRIVN